MRLFTIVWGAQHLDWFSRACVASLLQPSNAEALRKRVKTWDIVTRQEDEAQVRQTAAALGLPLELHFPALDGGAGVVLQRELIVQMGRCVETGTAIVMAPPDSMFGDGSMAAIMAVGEPNGVCVAVPHVRVKPGILEEPETMRSNAALVAAAWRHLHRTWVEAEVGLEDTNTWAGGVSWRRVADGLYAVQHRIPTIYLAKVDRSDLVWWNGWQAKQQLMGAWDHFWPSKLVAEQRQRVIGSSDAAFIAEVTPEFSNIPPINKAHLEEPDRFWGTGAHTVFNRNNIAIFRAAA